MVLKWWLLVDYGRKSITEKHYYQFQEKILVDKLEIKPAGSSIHIDAIVSTWRSETCNRT